MRSPRYSTSRVPAGMRRVAKTPAPWMAESRTRYGGRPRNRLIGCSGARRSDRHRRADRRVRLVVEDLDVLEAVVEQRRRQACKREPRQRPRRARQLLVDLLEVVQVQVAVAARPHELAGLE